MTGLRLLVADVLVLGGTAVMALGIAGILRLPDVQARIHSAGKAFALGVITIVFGAVIGAGDAAIAVRALVVAAFLFVTAPVGAHALADLEWRMRSGEFPAGRRLSGPEEGDAADGSRRR